MYLVQVCVKRNTGMWYVSSSAVQNVSIRMLTYVDVSIGLQLLVHEAFKCV